MISTKPPPPRTDNLVDAVRETVSTPRTRVARSQTALTTPTRQPTTPMRSQSQDSGVPPVPSSSEKPSKSSGKSRSKKGSQHADVIDRLDFTGVGPMFHHDGPFDACAPSRNRHRTKAPMMAWSGQHPADEAALSAANAADSGYPSEVRRNAAFFSAYQEPPKKKVDAIAEAWGIHEPEPFEEFHAGGGRNGDTPTNSIYGGKEGHGATPRNAPRTRGKTDLREVYRDYLEGDSAAPPSAAAASGPATAGGPRRPTKRLPPPQPIFSPDAAQALGEEPLPSPTPGPKRSRSIMQRIRKMRDTPNSPIDSDGPQSPGSDYGYPTAPGEIPPLPNGGATRPTHKSHHSFLGRFNQPSPRPNIPPAHDTTEQYVYVEKVERERPTKELPATPTEYEATPSPTEKSQEDYFDDTTLPPFGSAGGDRGGRLAPKRNTSILSKVGRVMKGAK